MINMAQKHLHELLKEDQEPFLLKNYIADKRCQLKRPSPKTHLQVKKRRPISQVSNFPGNLCKNACLFSLHDSPDLRKSPLFEFPSPAARSPCKSPNAIFLQIPNRTAALLVEAAMRIQKQSSSSKPKTQNKNHSFGLFGSFLKRLTNRNRTQKREIKGDGVKVSVKDILRWDSSVGRRKISNEEKIESCLAVEEQTASEMSTGCEVCFSSSSCTGRPSSAVWSETNEDKSLDLDTASSSSQSEDSEVIEFETQQRVDSACLCNCEKINNGFCDSPFRFVLQTTPSPSGHRTPEFSSPAASPSRHKQEEEGLKKFQVEEEEEEDKEQCSPVSVLDPPFQDDDEGRDGDGDDEDGFDLECSYANVQRTKNQLLQKLRRFEKLAGLDPIELEKRMSEEEEDDEYNMDDLEGQSEQYDDDEPETSDSRMEENLDELVREILSQSNFHCIRKRIPEDVKRLVSDLIVEEQKEEEEAAFSDKRVVVVRRVCERFESWKEVESNTIDMMVEQDFRKELDGWKKNQDQVGETAMEIEVAIFALLVDELAMELV
ncbi:PREDICTED: zinc-regulated 8 [Prunus dulcis]|uniref:PREDICTED: zinc-regulated 8 n=1 Tax=Prunus dulcis TaxID=3755 RepID=A0A5E4F813_PRUDU|nr:uncharacterized protein LOC117636022 [Prunus dulcis]VVA21898.1 PREDICTED: zinc-regulated 8 [Prunus dulcis]